MNPGFSGLEFQALPLHHKVLNINIQTHVIHSGKSNVDIESALLIKWFVTDKNNPDGLQLYVYRNGFKLKVTVKDNIKLLYILPCSYFR